MRELMWVYFPDDILMDWRHQPESSKNAVVEVLHREFPNPAGYQFNDNWTKSAMNQALKSMQGSARTAKKSGSRKPPGLSIDDWRRVSDEHRTFPNR